LARLVGKKRALLGPQLKPDVMQADAKGSILMRGFVPWNSQPIDAWAMRYAEGKFLDLAGRRTHFIERGQGKPIVLIHGFNLDLHTWTKNVDQLATRFKVYAPDLWGQGYSTRQVPEYGYDLFEEQIRLFMEALDIPKASMVGHSMGGGTAIVFTLRNPDRVDKLVLLDSAGIPTKLPLRSKIFRLQGVAELLMSLPTDRIRRRNLEDIWIHDRESLTEDFYREFTRYQKIEGTTEALLSILRADFFNTLGDEIRELGALAIPVLIIWGREDVSLPVRNAEEMIRLIPGSRLEILDNAGHLANFDRADAFNDLVIEFLCDQAA
jgi:pimeloyl-ACP methyl ester carboxylesterase